MKKIALTLLAAASLLAVGSAQAQTAVAASGPVPLIERVKLFGNPSKAGGSISPDGKWLAWVAPRDGVLNIWVAPVGQLDAAKPLTAEKVRPIRSVSWSPDGSSVLYINDKGGDENFLLYGVNVSTGEAKAYTPFEKTRVQIEGGSRLIKDRMLIGVNNRDPRFHDVHELNLKTGELKLVFKNEGFGALFSDDALKVRLAHRPRPDGGADYFRVDAQGQVEKTPIATVPMDDSLTTAPTGFSIDGKTLYWRDSRGRDTAALVAMDMATGQTKVLAQDARADIGGTLNDPKTGEPLAYSVNYLKNEYVAIDSRYKGDFERLSKASEGGAFYITSRSDDDRYWTIAMDPVVAPSSVWLYDRQALRLSKLYVSRPELEGAPLMPMHALELKSRDGLTLPSYLTLPAASEANAQGQAKKPVPLVLVVHGGPWARDGHGYNTYHQWLANRGYAVLSVNFRGSTGFGKNFVNAADLQWGRKMHDDLIDAVDWAIKTGVTTKDKVAIMGGSYGGYATLAGLTFTPNTFACGVDIVGPSNLFTLLQSIPPYWEAFKLQFHKRMGDPTTEAGRALLKERSPLTHVDKIVKPLLIGQGANDPRVNVRESDQIVEAMAAKKIPVTYVLFPDEGHGFARPVNNIAFNAVTENFLAQCLGGRSEPIGTSLKGSTAQIKHGAEFAQGLKAALEAK